MILAKFLAKQLSRPSGMAARLAAPLWNKRNAALNDLAFERLALGPADRVLDVGFGGGYLLGRMSAAVTGGFLAGVDLSPAMVALAEKRYRTLVQKGRLELKCGPAEALPYPAGHFTKICSVNSIFYWQDVPRALAEFWRVLAEKGGLVICFTVKSSLQKQDFGKYVSLYETDEVRQMVEAAGFSAIDMLQSADRHREFVCLTGHKQAWNSNSRLTA